MYQNAVKVIIGLMLIVTVLIGYIPKPEYLVELTCVSNTLCGLLLIADGILNIVKKKNLPSIFYLSGCVSILLVFVVCMFSLTGISKFNFSGVFLFLHVINPIAYLLCYLLFVNERQQRIRWVLATPVLTIMYFLFDYILGNIRGNFVYRFVEVSELNYFYAIIAGIITYVFVYLIGLCVFCLNRLIHKKIKSTV